MLKVYKTHPSATIPFFATEQAACFDISASLFSGQKVTYYTSMNSKNDITIINDFIKLMPRSRYLIPTSLILDIPEGYSVRIHPRSGISLKYGLSLANCEGVIDSDYIDPIFVALINNSNCEITINNGDRIAQGELVRNETTKIHEIFNAPASKTSRSGGFGSTGQ